MFTNKFIANADMKLTCRCGETKHVTQGETYYSHCKYPTLQEAINNGLKIQRMGLVTLLAVEEVS